MNRRLSITVALSLAANVASAQALRYSVDLGDRANHMFAVTLRLDSMGRGNDVLAFAATAPGTYQVMDIGRFVHDLRAFDGRGRPLATERVSTNQWKVADPQAVREFRYSVEETWGTKIKEHKMYPMTGTALRDSFALLNAQALFGIPKDMQAASVGVQLKYPADWQRATAMRDSSGVLLAENYDRLVDSPILVGRLTQARLEVTGVPVEIYSYSPTGKVTSTDLMESMRGMLTAAGAFLGKLPVDRYVFLFAFDIPPRGVPTPYGAWEHSYSSEYVLPEAPFTPAFGATVTNIAAHEFFHVVTPLNLHSEIIEHFNFDTPIPSRHLWLYEGLTEWAAHKMQLESGRQTVPEYLATVVQKHRNDRENYDTTYSLTKLAMTSYSDSGQRQYPTIYQKGAVIAGLLDLKLLELSDGRTGLKDLIHSLTERYGKQRPFPEDSLIDVIVEATSPEVRDFFTRYVDGAESPPIAEYYAKIGVNATFDSKGRLSGLAAAEHPTEAQLRLRNAWLGAAAGKAYVP